MGKLIKLFIAKHYKTYLKVLLFIVVIVPIIYGLLTLIFKNYLIDLNVYILIMPFLFALYFAFFVVTRTLFTFLFAINCPLSFSIPVKSYSLVASQFIIILLNSLVFIAATFLSCSFIHLINILLPNSIISTSIFPLRIGNLTYGFVDILNYIILPLFFGSGISLSLAIFNTGISRKNKSIFATLIIIFSFAIYIISLRFPRLFFSSEIFTTSFIMAIYILFIIISYFITCYLIDYKLEVRRQEVDELIEH